MQAIESAGPQCHGHSHLTDEPAAVVGRGWRQQPRVTLKQADDPSALFRTNAWRWPNRLISRAIRIGVS